MNLFAHLFERLDSTQSTSEKVDAIAEYFAAAPAEEKAAVERQRAEVSDARSKFRAAAPGSPAAKAAGKASAAKNAENLSRQAF